MRYGLKPTPRDDRDFALGAITTLPSLTELPPNFILPGIKIKDQEESDFCAGFASASMSELQEGVPLSGEWAFAKSKELSGDVDEFGQDIRTALSVHTKHGAVAESDCPYSLRNKDADFLRDIRNYPNLDKKAIKHFKKSYIKVTGPYDHFDNIRATIWKYQNEKRAVVSGLYWGWSKNQQILNTIPTEPRGHAIYYAGWREIKENIYLVLVNSYGKDAGDNGKHYISREVINHFVEMYGAYMFLDMAPDTIKYMLDNSITDRDNWITQLMKSMFTFMQELLKLKKNLK